MDQNLYHDKINKIFKKSYFTKKKFINNKNKFFIIKKNKYNKSLIDNLYNSIEKSYLYNKNNKVNKSFRIIVKKEKKEKLPKKIININFNLKSISWDLKTLKNITYFNPNVRLNTILNSYKNNIYLYGGISNINHTDLWKYNLKIREWQILKKKIIFDENIIYESTNCVVDNKILIFNIVRNYNSENKYINIVKEINLISTKITLYNIKKHKIIVKYIINKVSNKYLVKLGGESLLDDNIINNNLYLININNWGIIKFTLINKYFKFGIYKTKIVSVFNDLDNLNFNRYKINNFEDYEGFYLFGGYNKLIEHFKEMFLISISKNKLIVKEIKSFGKYPGPRTNHEMIFIKKINTIIIIGGIYYNTNIIYDEIVFYNINNYNFYYSKKNQKIKRYSFSADYDNNNEILIFGGYNEFEFCNNLLLRIQLKNI